MTVGVVFAGTTYMSPFVRFTAFKLNFILCAIRPVELAMTISTSTTLESSRSSSR